MAISRRKRPAGRKMLLLGTVDLLCSYANVLALYLKRDLNPKSKRKKYKMAKHHIEIREKEISQLCLVVSRTVSYFNALVK